MKTFMVTYTEDFGETYHTVPVSALTDADAYIALAAELSEDAAITALHEVNKNKLYIFSKISI